jgi:chromosome segregation ATPase
MAAITATSTELDKVRSEVASLGRALELARRQLAERDAQLAETKAALADSDAQREAAQRTASEERESAQQLRAELDGNSTVIAAIKQQVAGLSERLDSIAPAGAEPTEH